MGSVALRMSADPSANEPSIQFRIVDTGIGIEPSQINALFAPFERGPSDVAERVSGTGLGLPISDRLVRALGSKIHVVSVPGRGSTFAFELPIGASGPELSAAKPQLDLAGVRIGVACDRPLLNEMLSKILEPLGATLR